MIRRNPRDRSRGTIGIACLQALQVPPRRRRTQRGSNQRRPFREEDEA